MFKPLFQRRVLLGYFLSLATASFALTLTFHLLDETLGDPALVAALVFVAMALYTVLPSIGFVLFCERRRIRHFLAYVSFSALLSVSPLPLVLQDLSGEVLTLSLVFLPADWFPVWSIGSSPVVLPTTVKPISISRQMSSTD